MQMDGAALYAVVTELNASMAGGRIERIAQPDRYCVVMVIRANGSNQRLLLNADPEGARFHITENTAKGPEKPFQFLMTLRKHLLHGRIDSFLLPRMDRAVHLLITGLNELGDRVQYRLILECMGKHSNLILAGEDGTVIDAARRVPPAISSLRTVLPGSKYHAPPVQQKVSLVDADPEDLARILESYPSGSLSKAISDSFYGISPFTAQTLIEQCGQENIRAPFAPDVCKTLARHLCRFVTRIASRDIEPCLLFNAFNAPHGFFHEPVQGFSCESKKTFSAAVDAYFSLINSTRLFEREQKNMETVVVNRLGRLYKRRGYQHDTIAAAGNADQFRKEGELILANLWQIKRGDKTVMVTDYESDTVVVLTLDNTKTPSENAANRFKKYRKLKASIEAANAQLKEIEPEIEYLESVLYTIRHCANLEELADIRAELQDQHVLQAPQQRNKHVAQTAQPLHFTSSEGIEIFVGRNNNQNDLLTTRLSRPGDTWMHAQGMPGSHVLVRANPVPAVTLEEAAMIAAFFSGGRNSSNVPIDHTLIKYVRKPSGSKPGFVTYSNQKTIFITPDSVAVKKLMNRN
ncbi:MAG: NFACT family protein [Clostridia bacterium]|nr:NFACT family protein [Clostridia bacterium]